MKRILVTGGAGFIGSHLCELLMKEEGTHVTIWDNLSTGSSANVDLLLSKGIRFQEVDVTTVDTSHEHFDEIYHLACPASPKHYQKDPVGTIRTATLGTANMLQLARREKAKILIASTSEVYGNPERHPQREDYFGNVNPVGPRSCYDEGKRAAEAMATAYFHQFGLDVRIARIFNTYGPRMAKDDGRVIPNFIDAALRGDPIHIYGSGNQTRSFCYVDDTVKGLRMIMDSTCTEPVNLGSEDERSIEDVAISVKLACESTSLIVYLDGTPEDPFLRCPDIEKAQSIGWDSEVGFLEGLKKTVESRRANL